MASSETSETETVTPKELKELKRLRRENAELKEGIEKASNIVLKVTEKGCLGIYNIRSRPICIYVEEYERIRGADAQIEKFIKKNSDKLSRRGGNKEDDDE